MRRTVVFVPLVVGACSTMAAQEPEPPVRGETPGYTCRDEQLGGFVGREATSEVGSEMLQLSGARTLRWVAKGRMVTMDYRADRLTVWLDAQNRIERLNCG
jgi:Peptidase inhibitor I78 family